MRISPTIRWSIAVMVILVVPALGYYYFILDWKDKPFCHRQIMLGFYGWIDQESGHSKTLDNPFPNVGGVGRDSLAEVHAEMGEYMQWTQDYRYVPGLRQDDPGDLVLMYFNRPTRWNMHISQPTIFTSKQWILIPVDFTDTASRTPIGRGELSERVSTEEFKRRLTKTIDYIRTQKRPNWQTIVAEQSKFLESIDKAGSP